MSYRDRDYYRGPPMAPKEGGRLLLQVLGYGALAGLALGMLLWAVHGFEGPLDRSERERAKADAELHADASRTLKENAANPDYTWSAEDERWSLREVRKLQRAVERDAEQAVKPQEGAGGSPGGETAEDGSKVPPGFYASQDSSESGGTNSGCKTPKITYGDAGGGTGEATIGSGCTIELNRAQMADLSPRMQCTVIKHETAHLHGQEHTSSGWMAPHISEGDYAPGC